MKEKKQRKEIEHVKRSRIEIVGSSHAMDIMLVRRQYKEKNCHWFNEENTKEVEVLLVKEMEIFEEQLKQKILDLYHKRNP